MKILVFGSNGQVGRSLGDIEKTHMGEHAIKFYSKKELNICNKTLCKETILSENPDLIINAAAYTRVDDAETDYESANLINNIAVTNIANICKELDVSLIHYSTDYVFDGSKKTAYFEDDPTEPKSLYGKSKLDGENGVIKSGCNYIILRTSWVFSKYGKNFLKTIINLSKHKKNLGIVDDQYGCPTYAKDIAIATSKVISFINNKNYSGIYNYCGDFKCSWYEFANKIIFLNNDTNTNDLILTRTNSEEYFTDAPRPKNSVLNCEKYINTFGESFTNIDDAIKIVVDDLKNKNN